MTPRCDNGVCKAQCTAPRTNCNNACIDLQNDPLHCGNCFGGGSVCDSDEVCVQGDCRPWELGIGCNTCPCTSSCVGDFNQCCNLPGVPNVVACVDANACPMP
jgi:hypothetical protein